MAGLKLGEAPTKAEADAFWDQSVQPDKKTESPEKQALLDLYNLRQALFPDAENDPNLSKLVVEFDNVVKEKLGEGKQATQILSEIRHELAEPSVE